MQLLLAIFPLFKSPKMGMRFKKYIIPELYIIILDLFIYWGCQSIKKIIN